VKGGRFQGLGGGFHAIISPSQPPSVYPELRVCDMMYYDATPSMSDVYCYGRIIDLVRRTRKQICLLYGPNQCPDTRLHTITKPLLFQSGDRRLPITSIGVRIEAGDHGYIIIIGSLLVSQTSLIGQFNECTYESFLESRVLTSPFVLLG
jgi:hypothetical protein